MVSGRDAAAVLRAWRRLTTPRSARRAGPGERTLLACSGGADSCALVLALARPVTRGKLVVGHVVHDLRAREHALADRDAARTLAERLGLEFRELEVRVRRSGGNAEAAARRARYAALVEMARECGARFVATAHHADDQIETVLMTLLRGTGGAGVRGMAERRPLDGRGPEAVWLIRPMIGAEGVGRKECERLCRDAGVEWREDATNADTTRLRAALRHRVVPVLKELRPDLGTRAAAAARQADWTGRLLRAIAMAKLREGAILDKDAAWTWPRQELRAERTVVVGEMIRLARARVCGERGASRLSRRSIVAITRAVADDSTDPRTFRVGRDSRALEVRVLAREVRFGLANVSARP